MKVILACSSPVAKSILKPHSASVELCSADTYVETAATIAGSATDTHAAEKVAKCALREPGGYDFTPLVVESYDRQCSATYILLNLLGRLAADSGDQGDVGSRARCGD